MTEPETAEKTVRIVNRRGLHARAAAKFVKLVEKLKETHAVVVTVCKDDMEVGGESIMGLLMLSASLDTQVSLKAAGSGAKAVLDELAALIERRFDEDS